MLHNNLPFAVQIKIGSVVQAINALNVGSYTKAKFSGALVRGDVVVYPLSEYQPQGKDCNIRDNSNWYLKENACAATEQWGIAAVTYEQLELEPYYIIYV